jgi:hypothetical protein
MVIDNINSILIVKDTKKDWNIYKKNRKLANGLNIENRSNKCKCYRNCKKKIKNKKLSNKSEK